MIIKREIGLELDKIQVMLDPCNEKGKFSEFVFRLCDPWPSELVKKLRVGEEHFTVLWGGAQSISFYHKESRKELERLVMKIIKADMPQGITNIDSWQLIIKDYTSPRDDRNWAVYWQGSSDNDGAGCVLKCTRWPDVDRDTMAKIIALLPEDIIKQA